jgi:nitrogenase iron protein NifH
MKKGFSTLVVLNQVSRAGVGCAGRGIITSIGLLERLGAYEDNLDYVFYDFLGMLFAEGLQCNSRREGTGNLYSCQREMMALYAANNISKGIQKYAKTGG